MKNLIILLLICGTNLFSQEWEKTYKPEQNRYFEILKHQDKTYLLSYEQSKLIIYCTSDDGNSWKKVQENQNSGTFDYFSITADITDEGFIFIPRGSNGFITRLGFNPNTFLETKVNTEDVITSIKMQNNDIGIAGNDKELFITENSWVTSKEYSVEGMMSVWYSSDNSISYVSYEEGIGASFVRSIDKGENWETNFISNIIPEKLYFIDANIGFIVGGTIDNETSPWKYSDVIFRTSDAGKTWNNVLDNENVTLSSIFNISFNNSSIGIATGRSQSTYITYDGGINWEKQTIKDLEEEVTKVSACGFTQTNFLLAVRDYGVYSYNEPLLSVTSNLELNNKYQHTINENILSFQNHQFINYEVYNITGQKFMQGNTFDKIDLNQLGKGVYLINLNNELTVKYLK